MTHLYGLANSEWHLHISGVPLPTDNELKTGWISPLLSLILLVPSCPIFPQHKEAVWSKHMKSPHLHCGCLQPPPLPPERDLSLNGRGSFSATRPDRGRSSESERTSSGCRRKADLGGGDLRKISALFWGPDTDLWARPCGNSSDTFIWISHSKSTMINSLY